VPEAIVNVESVTPVTMEEVVSGTVYDPVQDSLV
jgi:hypothetical protein